MVLSLPWQLVMQKPLSDIYCPTCSAKLFSSSMFCGKCGHSFTGAEAAVVSHDNLSSPKVEASWLQMKQLVLFYTILLFASLIFGLTSRIYDSPTLEVVYWIADLITIGVFLQLTWSKSKNSFKINPATARTIFEMVVATLVAYFFITNYFKMFEVIGIKSAGLSESYLSASWPAWSIFIMSAVLPGIFEEIIFRGILQPNLVNLTSEWEALVIQAALFSVLHLLPAIFISHFVMGLLVGWIRQNTGHIYYGILLHIAWNSFVILDELQKL